MKLLSKCGITLTGLLVSLGCLAADPPPTWKLETEGAAPGDICWFTDKMMSDQFVMATVVRKDGKIYCFHEGEGEDWHIKKFGWLNATWDSLRARFISQQSIKTFIGSYKWYSDNQETRSRPLPKVETSEIAPEETVHMEVIRDEATGNEYLSLGILSSGSGQIKRLGEFPKSVNIASGTMMDVWVFAGCGWAMTGDSGSSHQSRKDWWTNECFSASAKACSFDNKGNWQSGNWVNKADCDGGKNSVFVKLSISEGVLSSDVIEFYKKRQ